MVSRWPEWPERLLDPDSEIRWVLANKQVFRLKEELATEPRFWYFID